MQSLPDPLDRREFDAATLMAEYPPRLHNANKQVVCDIASPPGSVHRGRIGFTRWAAMRIPPHLDPVADQLVLGAPGFFDYAPTHASEDAIEWHVNFADPNLFVAYAGGLFAQDEMQVAEHPALGALREAMAAAGAPATTDGPGGPTPILVTGVERRASVATEPDAAACRPRGLYGSAFAAAVPEVIRRATTSVDPPTITNLMAIAAIPGGRGVYRPDQIEKTLTTAFTGFQAAALESVRLGGRGTGVVVHTGYWGCGAFGGNRVLMALLQVVAAQMAGLERLVFHTGAPGGESALAQARRLLQELTRRDGVATEMLLGAIHAQGFAWGVGDGN